MNFVSVWNTQCSKYHACFVLGVLNMTFLPAYLKVSSSVIELTFWVRSQEILQRREPKVSLASSVLISSAFWRSLLPVPFYKTPVLFGFFLHVTWNQTTYPSSRMAVEVFRVAFGESVGGVRVWLRYQYFPSWEFFHPNHPHPSPPNPIPNVYGEAFSKK